MDYMDWCLQAYVTTITPITYSSAFHTVIRTLLAGLVTFGSFESLYVFFEGYITNVLQLYIITAWYYTFQTSFSGIVQITYDVLAKSTANGGYLPDSVLAVTRPVANVMYYLWVLTEYTTKATISALFAIPINVLVTATFDAST